MSDYKLISNLEFGYAPLSAFEFQLLRNDKEIRKALNNTFLYIIARRPLIQICDFVLDNFTRTASFVLTRSDVNYKLNCTFYVDSVQILKNRDLLIEQGSFTNDASKIHGLKFYDNDTKEFLFWTNPEKLLYLFSHDSIRLDVIGDIFDFLTFEVLYVGKCTDQHIFDRFKSHHALMDILIQEGIITPDYPNSHELVILPFEYRDNLFSGSYSYTNIDDMESDKQKFENVSEKSIALDEEKALINCLNPKYNKEKYKSYPVSTDGLYNQNLNTIVYSFAENIRLKYENGSILGNVDVFNPSVSFIGVQNNQAVIYKYEKLDNSDS